MPDKKANALAVECPVCHAKRYERCRILARNGSGAADTTAYDMSRTTKTFHPGRAEAARKLGYRV